MYSQFAQVSKRLSYEKSGGGGGFKANKHGVIKRGRGYKLLLAVAKEVTGAGETTVQPKPSSGELDPISAGAGIPTTLTDRLLFRVKVLWEKKKQKKT